MVAEKALVKVVVQEAVPVPLLLLGVTTAVAQTGVPPLVNATLPLTGTPFADALLGVIVAVKVTVWLTTAVVGRLEMTVPVVASLLTLWAKFGEVAAIKFASPVYVATMRSDGATRLLVVQAAVWPAVTVTAPQLGMTVPPLVKLTVPVGVVVKGCESESVAVKVTELSTADGLPDEVTARVGLAIATCWVTVFDAVGPV